MFAALWRSRSDAENPSRILRRTMKDVRRRHWGPTCPGAGSAVKSTVEVDSSVGLMKARCDAEIQIDLGINAAPRNGVFRNSSGTALKVPCNDLRKGAGCSTR